jgi:membrane protein
MQRTIDLPFGFVSLSWHYNMANVTFKSLAKLSREVWALLGGKGIDVDGEAESRLNPFERFIHFWVLTGRGFTQNRCPVRASALAYTTLLAFIPLLAVVASISTGLLKSKGEQPVEVLIEKLVESIAPQLDLIPKAEDEATGRQKVVRTITESIQKIHSGALGVTGMVGLVFVAIMLLSTVEATFNDIWGVSHGRTWLARIIRYWATVTLGPLIPILAVALNAGSQFQAVEKWVSRLPFVGQFLVGIVPFLVLSIAFAVFYQLMPNTRVRWQAALVGGVVGGCLWQLNSLFNVLYVSKVVTYTNIYGSLSLIPVFLIGLYFSWLILLFGAQVAYTFQNRKAYLQQRQAENVNEIGREFLALRIMTSIGQNFNQGATPPTAIELGQKLAVPTRLVGDVIQSLEQSGLLLEVESSETAFTLGRPLEKISCDNILQAVRQGQGKQVATREEPVRQLIEKEFQRIQEAEQTVSGGLNLASLVRAADETGGK